jgi:hypothetical protein
MKNILLKIAAVVSLLIGLMAAFTGTRVLLGSFIPDYNVLTWLVYYNVFMGLVSILTGLLIWKNYSKVLVFPLGITAGHISVLLSLLTIFNSVVAQQSINAMIFRSSIWLILLFVVWKNRFKNN